jgi:hypothetical protein
MVAALVLLDHEATLLALAVVQIVLKEEHFLLVALSLMDSQQAFTAEFLTALVAYHHGFGCGPDYALALLAGTQF